MIRALPYALAVAGVLACPAHSLAGQTGAATAGEPRGSAPLLDVPYVAQSADLCGGAALAMVLRYWGDETTSAVDFAHLVDRADGGIRTGRLVEAARARGWTTHPMQGVAGDVVRAHVREGRPAIALIEERPGVLHYVVVVAWTDEAIVVHDPARSPFRVFGHDEFDRRWAVTDRWLLVVLPAGASANGTGAEPPAAGTPDPTAGAIAPERAAPVPPVPCQDLLARGVALAAASDLSGAEALLTLATGRCPESSAGWRELAGVRFVQQRWADAERLATRAVAIAPDDEHGWRILAAARYQQSDWTGSLQAMRATGAPPIDLIEVGGAARTPHPVVIDATGLAAEAPLTAEAFARAARRLDALPIARRSRLTYRPAASDAMTVEAVIAEQDVYPRRWIDWAGIASRVASDGLLRVDVAGAARSGEVWSGQWRWSARRPLGGFRLATPAPGRLPGVAVVEAIWERQTYAIAGVPGAPRVAGTHAIVESRRRVAFGLSDWASGSWRWQADTALDRFDGRSYGALGGAIEVRGAGDRVSAGFAAAAWAGPAAQPFANASAHAAWRSSSSATRASWSAASGVSAVSASAPLALWPGAGIGRARPALLRAHPLLDDDVVAGEAFGRRLWHGTVEYARPVLRRPAANVAVIAFADAARAWRGREANAPGPASEPGQRLSVGPAPGVAHLDVGVGLRAGPPGMRGSLDVTVGYGVRDGRVVVSAGVRAPWPWLGSSGAR